MHNLFNINRVDNYLNWIESQRGERVRCNLARKWQRNQLRAYFHLGLNCVLLPLKCGIICFCHGNNRGIVPQQKAHLNIICVQRKDDIIPLHRISSRDLSWLMVIFNYRNINRTLIPTFDACRQGWPVAWIQFFDKWCNKLQELLIIQSILCQVILVKS